MKIYQKLPIFSSKDIIQCTSKIGVLFVLLISIPVAILDDNAKPTLN